MIWCVNLNPMFFYRLGMEHDGQGGNSCAEDAMTGSIMAPVVIAVYNLFFWSQANTDFLKQSVSHELAYTCPRNSENK